MSEDATIPRSIGRAFPDARLCRYNSLRSMMAVEKAKS
jgi:hypothetical protein